MSETGRGALAARGARTFKIGDEELTVFFDLNAQALLEETLDKPLHEIIAEIEFTTLNATTAREVLRAGLEGGGRTLTIEETGKYAIGQRVALHLAAALAQSQVPHEEIEELADKIDTANEAGRRKAADGLDKVTEELNRRPPTRKRGGKGGKRSRV